MKIVGQTGNDHPNALDGQRLTGPNGVFTLGPALSLEVPLAHPGGRADRILLDRKLLQVYNHHNWVRTGKAQRVRSSGGTNRLAFTNESLTNCYESS